MFRQITAIRLHWARAMLGLAVVCLLGFAAGSAWANDFKPVGGGWQAMDMVYDPASKSYLQLRFMPPTISHINWRQANEYAASQTFNGVQGRLAIVDNYDTHLLLMTKFHPDRNTWIGMSVNCKSVKAFWVDGTPVDKQDFVAWRMDQWYRTNINCYDNAGLDYMGVSYLPVNELFRWEAAGSAKAFPYLFIQFPTGKP